MSIFVPPGCVSCQDALNEMYQTNFGTKDTIANHHWATTFSDHSVRRSVRLSESQWKRMREVVLELQAKLFTEETTACYVGEDGLTDMKSSLFGHDNVSELIASNGQIRPDLVGQRVNFYIRPEGYKPDNMEDRKEVEHLVPDPKKPGAPNKSRDAVLVYWGMFPKGHRAQNLQWSQAEDAVNAQLKRLGLPEVKRTAFEKALRELPLVNR